jgi:hypothetical protein
MPASGEFTPASLAIQIPDRFQLAVVSVGNQGVDRGVGDLEILTIGMRAGVAVSIAGFSAAARAFGLGVGDNGS